MRSRLLARCVYPVAKTAQQDAPFGAEISFHRGVRSQKLDRYALRQLFLDFGRVVVAISYDEPRGELEEFEEQVEFMGVGRSYAQASDEQSEGG